MFNYVLWKIYLLFDDAKLHLYFHVCKKCPEF